MTETSRASEGQGEPPGPPGGARRVPPSLVAARVAAVATLGVGTLWLLRPFLSGVAWAAILAYVTGPLHRWLSARIPWARAAAATCTMLAFLLIGVPFSWVLWALGQEAAELFPPVVAWVERGAPLPAWVTERAWLAQLFDRVRDLVPAGGEALFPDVARALGRLSGHLGELARGIARNVLQLGVMLLTLYVLYLEGPGVAARTRSMVGLLFPGRSKLVLGRVGEAMRGVIWGLLATGVIQGVLAGAGYAVAGIPAPVVLGAATTLLSFIPTAPTLIGLGAAAWLATGEHWLAAGGLAVWVLLVVASVDNVVRPFVMAGATRLPFLLVFFGIAGGLATFGLLGLVAGPVFFAVVMVLIGELPDGQERAASRDAETEDADA